MIRHLEQSGLETEHQKSFSILHSEQSILRQLRVAENKLRHFPDAELTKGMATYVTHLKYTTLHTIFV